MKPISRTKMKKAQKERWTKKKIIEHNKQQHIQHETSTDKKRKRKVEDVVVDLGKISSTVEDCEPSIRRSKRKIVLEAKTKLRNKKHTINSVVKTSNKIKVSVPVFPSIHTRTSPKSLFISVHSLSSAQKLCLKDMGFGEMEKFNIDSIPAKLGFFVVENFDDSELVIKVSRGEIQVTKEAIHEMLGIPIGGISIDSLDENEEDDVIVSEWRKQYVSNEISLGDLKKNIVQNKSADWNFRLNFIVLFSNIIGGCKLRGKCDLNILKKIRADMNIAGVDWCSYILSRLKGCKKNWKNDELGFSYAGPVPLLMLIYLDATKCERVKVSRRRPAVRGWNYEKMKEREDYEMKVGGFGLCELQQPYEQSAENELKRDEDCDDDEGGIYSYKPVDKKGYVLKMTTLYNRIVSDKDQLKITARECMRIYGEEVEVVESRKKIEELIGSFIVGEDSINTKENEVCNVASGSGVVKESDTNIVVENVEKQLSYGSDETDMVIDTPDRENYNLAINGGNNALENVTSDIFVNEGAKVVIEQKHEKDSDGVVVEKCVKFAPEQSHEKVVEQSAKVLTENTPDKCLTTHDVEDCVVTPIFNTKYTMEYLDEINDSFEKAMKTLKENKTIEGSEIPNFSLGLTQDFDDVALEENLPVVVSVEPLNARMPVKQTRASIREKGKRIANASDYVRSPFYIRQVDINMPLTLEEKKIVAYVALHTGPHLDVVFECVGNQTTLEEMESLYGGHIYPQIINCWSALLNLDEDKKSKEKPLRLFCSNDMMSERMLWYSMEDTTRLNLFTEKMVSVVKNNSDMTNLKMFELVFFPIVDGQNYYLICYNLKNPAFLIIDHKSDANSSAYYRGIPEKLHNTFISYLEMVGHVNWKRIRDANPERLQMNWQTSRKNESNGIFVMRHMESYFGEIGGKWDCGFGTDGRTQAAQVKKLRERYISKIILSGHNVQKGKVIGQAEAKWKKKK